MEADNLSVIRARSNVLDESSVGLITTEGDPRSNFDNSLLGVDFLYRNTHLPGGRTLQAEAWLQRSDTESAGGETAASGSGLPSGAEDVDGAGRAAGVGFSVPSNAGFRGGLSVRQFEDDFNPALGFMNRRGIRDYSGHVGYTLRPESGDWQSAYFVVDFQRIEDVDGALQSQSIGVVPLELTSRAGDVIYVKSNVDKEVLTAPFEISPGVVIPPGSYSFSDLGLEHRWAGYRTWSGRIAYIEGDFYTGEMDRWFGGVTWQPSPRFRGSLNFDVTDVDLPEGEFTTRIVSAGLDFVFSSELSWVNLLQYDNVSDTIGLNSRLHWIPEAGRELYFVVNHSLEYLDGSTESLLADATAKFSYTFRF